VWFSGYPDPEYFLRLLLHSESSGNQGNFKNGEFDALIELARRERNRRTRVRLFHQADRLAVSEQVAIIPLTYGRNETISKP
jgi:oligopeptide transport system substrate-binding protein